MFIFDLLNEADPHKFDSDVDYYKALRGPVRKQHDDYDVEPSEPYDPEGEMLQRQAARSAKTIKPTVNYTSQEGQAPNGQRYNTVMTISAPDKMSADNEIRKFNDHEWGAKKIVDTVKDGSNYTVYIVDNHKYGMWSPFKKDELEEGREGFSSEIVSLLKSHGFKGPARLEQLSAWYNELGDLIDGDDMIMVAGNDPSFDSYVAYCTGRGRYIEGGEGGYTWLTSKALINSFTMDETKVLDKIADREHSLKRDRFRSLNKNGLRESEVEYTIGDDVIITGPVQYKGKTGVVDSFGNDKKFVVVDLYNYGKHSFHSSDVSFNDYAGSEEEHDDWDELSMRESGYDFK